MKAPGGLALRIQFDTPEQQRAAAQAGTWAFLATEVLMFGALLTAWAVYRAWYGDAFALASNRMDVVVGTLNTGILLTSSLMMALAVTSAERGRRSATSIFLVGTILLGATFLVMKGMEYLHHYHLGEMPGFNWRYEGREAPHVEMFFVFYYVVTGLHAIHMIVGLGLLLVLLVRTWMGRFTEQYSTPVEMTGIYWHFVDIVWVFLFPLFYLIGRHGTV
ncbi:MAG: cytochrome c oxidase subunit 3 [Bryobacteraceae bacterium]|nr:cytochrome c oxidase subunit 3 [Bryobacteraceae bacterium]